MPKVHILPPEVISKIAAGEVIERPASVIKELLENSLDAAATSIEIHIKDAGKTLIHIKDNGSGIAQEDIETIFLRHSTSKIETADDLYNIGSLGFRGEALYSISAISDIVLRSRTKKQDTGWEIHKRDSKKLDLRPVTMAGVGTEIEAKELFFNTPARRKFLKSDSTELNQILNTVIPYTLLYPERRFLLTHQGKNLLDLKPADSHLTRFTDTLNVPQSALSDIAQEFDDKDISIRMILSDINIQRARRDLQFIFVNNRPVANKNISFHMNEVYRLILPPNAYPCFALYIMVPAENVDVNIHPTKREVKIKDELLLGSLLRRMCEQALMSGQAKQVEGKKIDNASAITRALSSAEHFKKTLDDLLPQEIFQQSAKPAAQAPTEQYAFPQKETLSIAGETLFTKGLTQGKESLQSKLARSRYIGSFIDKFLFFEVDHSLLVMDQHAGQERITFEHFIKQMQKGKIEVQHLLSPYLIKLSPLEVVAWEGAQEKLDVIGFSSSLFDATTVAVHTYPVLIKEPEAAVRSLLAGENVARCDHETIARRACRCSIMAGDPLNPEQAVYLRDELIKTRDPFTCPHGRPTVVEINEAFLDKQFLRT